MRNLLLFFLVVFSTLNAEKLYAKDDYTKFGKIPTEELTATTCPIDSNAHAYYIFDIGSSDFSYNNNVGFNLIYQRHFRIKILDKSGLDEATISIPYYESRSSRDYVQSIKACSYTLENGKIVKTQLKKSDIFDEQTSKYWKQVKFAIPNVKEGSVIEVSYRKSTDRYWAIPGWRFQYYIPVLKSKYDVGIPEYFYFNQFPRGYHLPNTQTSSGSSTIQLSDGSVINYIKNYFNYTLDNIPAFPIGEELTTPDNYISKVDYELASTHFPGKLYKNYSQTWDDVNKLFVDDEDFGYRLKANGFLKDEASAISGSSSNATDKLQSAFSLIKSKMKWNGNSSCWATAPLRKSYETGTGNSSDINLTLVALLKQLGLETYPVVLSTRTNGMIHPVNPSINEMNYVIALCIINGTNYLMDATDKYSCLNILPVRCLNGEGLIIDQNFKGWIPLLQDKTTKTVTSYNVTIDNAGKINGDIAVIDNNYIALKKRNRIHDYESVDKYIEKLEENNPGLKINDFNFTNLDSANAELRYNLTVDISDHVALAGNLVYFKPLLFDSYEKNPFSLKEREYPIEYAYPFNEVVIVNIKIPEGYVVESLPKPIKIIAYGDNCQLLYNTSQLSDIISVISSIKINKTLIPSQHYSEIRDFFEKVVEKHQEQIVLKKSEK